MGSLWRSYRVAISGTHTWSVRWTWLWRCCPGPSITDAPHYLPVGQHLRWRVGNSTRVLYPTPTHIGVWPALTRVYVVQAIYKFSFGADQVQGRVIAAPEPRTAPVAWRESAKPQKEKKQHNVCS